MSRWQSSQRLRADDKPHEEQIMKADSDLSNTLRHKDGGVNDLDAGILASQKLGSYLSARKKRTDDVTSPAQTTSQRLEPRDPLKAIPKSYRTKAGSLLEMWEREPRLSWDDANRVYIDGTLVPNSNLTDLLLHAVGRSRAASQPPGMPQLKEISIDANIPTSLFTNPAWRRSPDSLAAAPLSIPATSHGDATPAGAGKLYESRKKGKFMKRATTPETVKRARGAEGQTPRSRYTKDRPQNAFSRWQIPK